jgi:hypothetical protein
MRRIFNTILTIIITLTVVSIAFAPIPTQAGANTAIPIRASTKLNPLLLNLE